MEYKNASYIKSSRDLSASFLIRSTIPYYCQLDLTRNLELTYIRHDRLAIGILDIAERHLSAFMLVDEQFRVVEVGNFLKGN
jgi:hypothetical protein